MTHKTLVIDLDRCIGCYACEVACKNENSIPLGVHYNKVLTIGPLGKFPDIQQYFLPSVSIFYRPFAKTVVRLPV